MNKKLDHLENFKTAVLVVLFLVTILLLYLNLNQNAGSFSVSEVLPAGRSEMIQIDAGDYLVPSYIVQSEANGKYRISYRNQRRTFEAASECAKVLLSSSNISITQIPKEDYEKVCRENNAIILIFDFEFPFDEYCSKLIGKTLQKPENFKAFNSILFSDVVKSDLYFRDNDENCFKISVAENYYSTEALGRVIEFDVGEIGFNYLFQLSFRSMGLDEEIPFENAAEDIFGDTLDFVRKITDTAGNETYMYGYGQKRLSIFANGELEFKSDVKGENTPDFYNDLQSALLFSKEKLGIDPSRLKLISAGVENDGEASYYHFEFYAGKYEIITETKSGQVSYYRVSKN